jgi:hypothetical protein
MRPLFNLPLKPGHTTTEFWIVILTGLLGTAMAALQLLSAPWVGGAFIVLALLYQQSRAKLKTIQAQTEAEGIKTDFRIQEAAELASLAAQPPIQILDSLPPSESPPPTPTPPPPKA